MVYPNTQNSDSSERTSIRRKGVQRHRLVRKESWCSYLLSLPFDAWLSISESFQVSMTSLFDQELQAYMSFFLGIGLNAAAVWSRYKLQKHIYSSTDLIPGELATLFSEGGLSTEGSLLLLPILLFILSLLNAGFLFSQVREYTLFHADLSRHVDSRGVLKSSSLEYVKFSQPDIVGHDEEKGVIRKLLSYIWSWLVSIFFQELQGEHTTSNVLVLTLWDGPTFPLSINLFCVFSPVHVLVYGFSIAWEGFISLVVLHVLMSVEFIVLTWYFCRLLTDQKILSEELHNEYDQHLVYPQMHELLQIKLREENRTKALEQTRKKILAIREATRLDTTTNDYSAPEEE